MSKNKKKIQKLKKKIADLETKVQSQQKNSDYLVEKITHQLEELLKEPKLEDLY